MFFADGPMELPAGIEEFVSEPLVANGACSLTYQQWYHEAVQKPRADAFRARAIEDTIRGHFGIP